MGLRIALYNSNLFSIDSCDLIYIVFIFIKSFLRMKETKDREKDRTSRHLFEYGILNENKILIDRHLIDLDVISSRYNVTTCESGSILRDDKVERELGRGRSRSDADLKTEFSIAH